MPRKATAFRLDEDLLGRVDRACEDLGQTRTLFVVRALEKALDGVSGGVASEPRSAVKRAKGSLPPADVPPASRRASLRVVDGVQRGSPSPSLDRFRDW